MFIFNMRTAFIFIWICFFQFVSSQRKYLYTSSPECENELSVNSNGPVTLDIPITFIANLSCNEEKEEYVFVFEDDASPAHRLEIRANKSVSASFIYSEKTYNPGKYNMKVSVYYTEDFFPFFYIKVASKTVPFDVTEYIPGSLNLTGIITRENDDNLYVATGSAINMSIIIHYPEHVYEESEMSYSWTISEDQYITMLPFNRYKFTKPGTFDIHCTAVARIPIYDERTKVADHIKYKWGHYFQRVIVRDAFYAINLTGNNYLQHGQLFNLDVSCNGSGPFEYCWKVYQPQDNVTNLTCTSPVVTNQCSFPIIYYFHTSGNYLVVIHVDNSVSSLERDIEVHVYDVSLKPQLSTVIIPIFCSVLVLFIIAVGVMLHLRCTQQVDIETADFDFLQSETCVVETFWERLYYSILKCVGLGRLKKQCLPLPSEGMTTLPNQYESLDRY